MILFNKGDKMEEKIIKIIKKYGKDIINNKTFISQKKYIQHADISVYEHVLNVCYLSVKIALKYNIKVNYKSLVRGALLHDYFLYDWHEKDASHRLHGFTHPYKAAKNAKRDFNINKLEENIIKRHMFPLTPIPPKYKEGLIVTLADKICATKEIFKIKKQYFEKLIEEY